MERYSLQKVIGEGSFGRALLVSCKSSHEKYVLKEIHLPKRLSHLENSRREAVLLSRMKHPNIVVFREAFEADDLLCIVMEYCSGGDLLQRIRKQKTTQFSVDDILRWFAQICSAAQHIHEKQVLHRDLKSKNKRWITQFIGWMHVDRISSNIFLTDKETIKLGDFGSACILNSSKAYAQTYVGTPYYVAPEIWENKPYNNKSDVWSLGCVLYELCTLRHPFQASSWKGLILKVCQGAFPPLPRHLPYELQYLIKQMFKTNPKDRPSLRTILTSHRVSRLLRAHLPSQAMESEEQGRRMGRWNREEGKKVANLLGEKNLIKTSTFEDAALPEAHHESSREPGVRKQWAAEPSDAVLQMLANASLVSSDSMASDSQTLTGVSEESRQRRRWERDPPERLLSLLEKARLSRAFSTFLINRGDYPAVANDKNGPLGCEDPLTGPLSQPQGDDTDGPEPEVAIDEERLKPRSDDEDTDFEEESPCDWIDEVEKMFSNH